MLRNMLSYRVGATFATILCSGIAIADAQPRAADLPIADVHFHLMLFMEANALKDRMDRSNVRWTVSAGAIGSIQKGDPFSRDTQAWTVLGNRFITAVGGRETYRGELDEGTKFLTDQVNERRNRELSRMDQLLAGGHRSLVETYPNAITSSADPLRRRKVPTNSPFFVEMMRLAIKHRTPLPMHMQWHADSVTELENLLATHPDGVIVLSHCGKDTVAENIRPLLTRHSNVFCDLGFRSTPQTTDESRKDPARTIFWGPDITGVAGVRPDWKRLIEDFPDRFMVAIDDVHSWEDYDKVVVSIRTGLLDQLSPEAAEKVAYKNAIRVYRLKVVD